MKMLKNRRTLTAALAVAVLVAAAGCGDDDETTTTEAPAVEATEAEEAPQAEPVETEATETEATETEAPETEATETEATETEAPETEATEPVETEMEGSEEGPAGEAVDDEMLALAGELCTAWGQVHEPGGVDQLLSLMTDDVVVTDMTLGADLVGPEAVRGYVTSDLFAPMDIMECGAVVSEGAWAGGSYTLSSTTEPGSGQGVTAIHVTDGKIDRQLMYYTPTEKRAPAPDAEPVEDSTILAYCQAWDEGIDTEAMVTYLADDAQLVVGEPMVGRDAFVQFAEVFDFDQADCGEWMAENGEWAVATTIFTNTTSGTSLSGVNVVRLDEDGLITEHHPLMDAGV